jgi:hypothetical protein
MTDVRRMQPQTLRLMAGWAAAPRPREPPAAGGRTSTAARDHCELCPIGLGDDHRHLLHLDERRIICVCETCWSLRSGDAEYRATGARTVWLEDFVLADDVWAAFAIPIGLAFMMRSSVDGRIVAMYPSPAGATESELDLDAWNRLEAANPELARMEPDAEALIVNRIASPPQVVLVPIDQAYKLVGLIKARWEGISGGTQTEDAVAEFFAGLRERTGGSLAPGGVQAPFRLDVVAS